MVSASRSVLGRKTSLTGAPCGCAVTGAHFRSHLLRKCLYEPLRGSTSPETHCRSHLLRKCLYEPLRGSTSPETHCRSHLLRKCSSVQRVLHRVVDLGVAGAAA